MNPKQCSSGRWALVIVWAAVIAVMVLAVFVYRHP